MNYKREFTVIQIRNVKSMEKSVQPRPFVDFLILDVINWFIFGHGVLIYYFQKSCMYCFTKILQCETTKVLLFNEVEHRKIF